MTTPTNTLAPTPERPGDRVRRNTSASVNQKIDEKVLARVQEYADKTDADITGRIQELDREWDTERILEANASVLAFAGLILGLTVNQNWFWLPGIVLPFLFQHALQGWCPPIPVIRRLGVRTPYEIDQEKYALKTLRGDFSEPASTSFPEGESKAKAVLKSVRV